METNFPEDTEEHKGSSESECYQPAKLENSASDSSSSQSEASPKPLTPSSHGKGSMVSPESEAGPLTRDEARELAFQQAGVTLQERAEGINKAFHKTKDLIDAKRTEFFSYRGVCTDEREVADHAIQLQASRDMLEFYGPGKQARQASAPATVVVKVELPAWAIARDVTPKDQENQ